MIGPWWKELENGDMLYAAVETKDDVEVTPPLGWEPVPDDSPSDPNSDNTRG
jgi:hypothetical protein